MRKLQKGGQNKPKIYTDRKQFEQAQRRYSDSLYAYENIPNIFYDKMGDSFDPKNPNRKERVPTNLEKVGFSYKGIAPTNMIDYANGPAPYSYKKPVQPVVYQPNGTVSSPQTVSSQQGKSGIWGNEYNKKHPPIYVTNPKDPRIGQYGKDGNQYLYKGPTHPIQKMSRINPQQMDLNSNVNIQGQPLPFPQFQLPQQKGTPVYGPGNTIVGYSDNMNFKPAYQYTGAPNNQLNLQDKVLLDNPEELKKYLSKKDNYKFSNQKFQNGGVKPKVYTDRKQFEQAQRMYNDSLNLYNYTKFQHQLEDGEAGLIGKGFSKIANFANDNPGNVDFDKRKKLNENRYNNINSTGQRYKESDRNSFLNSGVDDYEKNKKYQPLYNFANTMIKNNPDNIAYFNSADSPDIMHRTIKPKGSWTGYGQNWDYSNVYPVQPVTYQGVENIPKGKIYAKIVNNNSKKANFPNPIQRYGQYNAEDMEDDINSIFPQQYILPAGSINIQGQPLPFPQFQFPQQKGTPVYGPGNTIVGYSDNMNFKPAYQYTGAPNNTLNLQDKALLENPEALRKYVLSRDNYKFPIQEFKDGGGKMNPPKVYTDKKQFEQAQKMYNDSLNAYNFGKNQLSLYEDLLNKNMLSNTSDPNDYAFKETYDAERKKEFQKFGLYKQGNSNLKPDKYWGGKTKNIKPSDIIRGQNYNAEKYSIDQPMFATYKKPVQPVVFRSHPIQKMDRLSFSTQGSSQVNIQGVPLNVQPMVLPQQNGTPVYGPGNTIIGYSNNMQFQPAWNYTGAANNAMNLQDKALLNDHEALRKYISSRDNYRFHMGGQKTFDEYLRQQNKPITDKNNFSKVPYTQQQSQSLINQRNTEKRLAQEKLNQEIAARNTKNRGDKFQLPSGQNKYYSQMSPKEKFYIDGLSLQNKGRWNEDEVEQPFLNSLNPIKWIYDMAGNLGKAPMDAKTSNSNLPYLSAIGEPLLAGALGFSPLDFAGNQLSKNFLKKSFTPNLNNIGTESFTPRFKGARTDAIDFIGREEVGSPTFGGYGYPTQVSGAGMNVYPNTPNRFLNKDYSSFGNMESGVVNNVTRPIKSVDDLVNEAFGTSTPSTPNLPTTPFIIGDEFAQPLTNISDAALLSEAEFQRLRQVIRENPSYLSDNNIVATDHYMNDFIASPNVNSYRYRSGLEPYEPIYNQLTPTQLKGLTKKQTLLDKIRNNISSNVDKINKNIGKLDEKAGSYFNKTKEIENNKFIDDINTELNKGVGIKKDEIPIKVELLPSSSKDNKFLKVYLDLDKNGKFIQTGVIELSNEIGNKKKLSSQLRAFFNSPIAELGKPKPRGLVKVGDFPTQWVGMSTELPSSINVTGVGGELGESIKRAIKKQDKNADLFSSTSHTDQGATRYLHEYLNGRKKLVDAGWNSHWLIEADKVKAAYPNGISKEELKLLMEKNPDLKLPFGAKFKYKKGGEMKKNKNKKYDIGGEMENPFLANLPYSADGLYTPLSENESKLMSNIASNPQLGGNPMLNKSWWKNSNWKEFGQEMRGQIENGIYMMDHTNKSDVEYFRKSMLDNMNNQTRLKLRDEYYPYNAMTPLQVNKLGGTTKKLKKYKC